jgi:hypothetical protein
MSIANEFMGVIRNIPNKIYAKMLPIYLFFKYWYQILATVVYLRKLRLKSKNLSLNLTSRSLIEFPSFIHPVLNTSIAAFNDYLIGVSRISNAGFEDKSDLIGRPIQSYRKTLSPLQNGIIKFNLFFDGKISNLEFIHDISTIPNYEDPRVFFLDGQEYIVMTQVIRSVGNSKSPFQSNIVLENLTTREIVEIPSPFAKRIEKNWVPIIDNKYITLLYGSNPVTLVEINPSNWSHNFIFTQNKSAERLNNRTQVIKTPNSKIPYIRVASRKFAVRRYGYTPLHYFEILNENMEPMKLSRPFIFSSRKQEYCQGIAIIDSKVYLSWSEQEKYNYIGAIEIQEVIKLFEI